METVGTCLKKEREANNISLKEVARKTKITAIYLKYIEKDEFDKLPQGPYIKAYLSSYSRAIGSDVDKIINLYESNNREWTQPEANQPANVSMDGGNRSANKSKTKRRKQPSSLRWSNLRSWFNTLVVFLVAKGASLKATKKPTDAIESSKPNFRKSFRYSVGRVKKPLLRVTSRRWLTYRRIWIYACVAIFGGFILFIAKVGFYNLFLYDSDTISVAKAVTTPDKEKYQSSSIGSRPSMVPSPSTGESGAADTPKGHAANNRLSESSKSAPSISEAIPEADISSGTSRPTTQTGVSSSESSSKTQQAALLREYAELDSAGASVLQSVKNDPSPKPTIVDASLRVLEANICRAIENRIPVGVDRSFPISDGKIYVWTKIEAKQVPSKVHHIYYFGEKKISDVSLNVRSTRWRTWSSKTISNLNYRGEWRVDIASSNGDVLRRLYFDVK